jgi:hypothetical protein
LAADGTWRPDSWTTWNLGLSGTDAWANTECTSTAWYAGTGFIDEGEWGDHVPGEDICARLQALLEQPVTVR